MSSSKKVGIMISAEPASASFRKAMTAADLHLSGGAQVYIYWIDRGVEGLNDPNIPRLKTRGAHLFACAFSLQRRGLEPPAETTLAGLTILSDIMSSADLFESFN